MVLSPAPESSASIAVPHVDVGASVSTEQVLISSEYVQGAWSYEGATYT